MIDATELGNAILNATFSTTIAKTKTFALPMADFPLNAILAMLSHGAQRKFNDACGGADKSADEKVSIAEAMIADFKAGNVTKRRAASGADAETLAYRRIMKAILKAEISKDDWKRFVEMEPVAQSAKLDELIEVHADRVIAEHAAEIEFEALKAQRAAKIAKKVDIFL